MNGCDYRIGATLAFPNYDGLIHLLCPIGKEAQIVVPGFGGPLCTIDLPPQTQVVDYANQGLGGNTRDLLITWTATEFIYTVTYPGPPGSSMCGNLGTFKDGKYTGTFTLKGFKNAALTEQIGIWVE